MSPEEEGGEDLEAESLKRSRKTLGNVPHLRRLLQKAGSWHQTSGYVQSKIPTRSNATEQEVLAKFQRLALENYESLAMLGVKMDLTDLIYDDKAEGVDEGVDDSPYFGEGRRS